MSVTELDCWIETACAVGTDFKITSHALRQNYLWWCASHTPGRSMGARRWRAALIARGFTPWRSASERGFRGIRALEDWEYKPEIRDVAARLSPHGNRPTRARAHKREPIIDRDPGDESP